MNITSVICKYDDGSVEDIRCKELNRGSVLVLHGISCETLNEFSNYLSSNGLTCLVIGLDSTDSFDKIQMLNEEQMNKYGWYRKNENQE